MRSVDIICSIIQRPVRVFNQAVKKAFVIQESYHGLFSFSFWEFRVNQFERFLLSLLLEMFCQE
jgi:hypothetical protein